MYGVGKQQFTKQQLFNTGCRIMACLVSPRQYLCLQALLYGIINGPQAVSRVGVVNITAGRLLLYKHQGRRPLFSRDQQLAGVKSVTDA
jgi:hypothetical protein